jgi:hypothetical protein
VAHAIGSTIEGSSFFGLLTCVEIGHKVSRRPSGPSSFADRIRID